MDILFGPITLGRHLYRRVTRDSGDPSTVPLAQALWVVEKATPALAAAAVRYLAETGATQRVVPDRLQAQHTVAIGAQRLRALAEHVSGALAARRPRARVHRALDRLARANQNESDT